MSNVASVLEYMSMVGFGFRPTDEELVAHYLTNKLKGKDVGLQIIPEVDVCKYEPWDLPAFSFIKSDDQEWFFFSPRDYTNSTRSKRATLCGYWKPTGPDRYIKVRGSNEIIGTKKTLVFYRGRVLNGVKMNWVIHEYHAAAFPVDQRTFVLCKLMKRPEKAEGRTGDRGGPSNFMPSDCEIVPSEGGIPDELSFQFPPRFNSHIGNDDSSVNEPFTQEELAWLNSLFSSDEEGVYSSQGMIAAIDAFTLSEPLEMYWESSDTDAEVVSAQYGYIPETSIKSNENDGPSEILLISEVNSSELSSNREAKQERKGRSFQDDFLPTKEAYHEAQKETPVHSNNNKREARVTDRRNTSKSPSSESSGVNGRNTFIQLETPSSSQNLSPPSVYLGNVVIGLFLFVVIIWEMLSCGKFW